MSYLVVIELEKEMKSLKETIKQLRNPLVSDACDCLYVDMGFCPHLKPGGYCENKRNAITEKENKDNE